MMFHTWFGEIELSTLALLLTLFIILPAQIFLCFRMENLFVRLLPVIVLSALILFYFVMSIMTAGSWDPFFFIVFAVLTGLMLLPCGIVWGIWAVVRIYKKKQS